MKSIFEFIGLPSMDRFRDYSHNYIKILLIYIYIINLLYFYFNRNQKAKTKQIALQSNETNYIET